MDTQKRSSAFSSLLTKRTRKKLLHHLILGHRPRILGRRNPDPKDESSTCEADTDAMCSFSKYSAAHFIQICFFRLGQEFIHPWSLCGSRWRLLQQAELNTHCGGGSGTCCLISGPPWMGKECGTQGSGSRSLAQAKIPDAPVLSFLLESNPCRI